MSLTACSQTQQVTCNKPYTLVGNSCCLDKNDNKICDKDEETAKNEVVCSPPYIKVGTNCCLDKNNNKICDNEETKETVEKSTNYDEISKNFTIEDLQADIGNVLGRAVFLTKDSELDYRIVYSNKIENSKLLGKYVQRPYFKFTIKKPEVVIYITDTNYYLNNKSDFQNFVKKNKYFFVESALESKELFEKEFKEGELLKLILLLRKPSISSSIAEKAKYANHSETSSIYYDNLTFPETVSNDIANINYVRLNEYEVNFTSQDGKYSEKLSNINYGQSVVIHCSPNMVISLNFEDYGNSIYEKNYDYGQTENLVSSSIKNHYNQLIGDSLAITKMCEQRYQFSYLGWR